MLRQLIICSLLCASISAGEFADLYGDCMQSPCNTGLICVGIDDQTAYCFKECSGDESGVCQRSETCHQLHNSQHAAINIYACMQLVTESEPCGAINGGWAFCKAGFVCTSDNIELGTGFCMRKEL